MPTQSPFITHLLAKDPYPDAAERLSLFGRFIGSWQMEITFVGTAGQHTTQDADWYFAWALGGRAIQDILVQKGPTIADKKALSVGTTLRMPNPATDSWHVCWVGPTGGNFCVLTARPDGPAIQLEGYNACLSENLVWRFDDIAPNSFSWRGEVSVDGGLSWRLEQVMQGRRK